MSFIGWLNKLRKIKPKKKRSVSAKEDVVTGPDAVRIREALPADLASLLIGTTAVEYRSIEDYEERQQSLFEALSAFDPDLCTSEDWLAAYRHLFRNRCLRSSGVMRNNAVQKALRDAAKKGADIQALRLGFKAAVEQGQWDIAKTCLGHLFDSRHVGHEERHRLQACFDLQTGQVEGAFEKLLPNQKHFNPAFRDYVSGKSVAIVGPARSEEPSGAEIDACDIIVRPNHASIVPEYDRVRMGSRVDISLYANGVIQQANVDQLDNPLAPWFRDLDWVLFKKHGVPIHEGLGMANKVVVGALDDFMFNGSPNAIPFAVHTMLCYRPRRVKVFNSNFFFSKTPYATHYTQVAAQMHVPTQLGAMAGHDCISQIHFFRNLQSAGLLDMNQESRDVIDMTTDAYLSGLERLIIHPCLPQDSRDERQ